MWKLNNTLIVKKSKKKREIRKYLETNENTTYQNLWDAVKAVL